MSSTGQLDHLQDLLGRNIDDQKRFESTYLDSSLASGWRSKLLLFGAGPLGRRILGGLRRLGIEPLAFVDNNESKWQLTMDRLAVLSPSEAIRRFGSDASVVVCVWRSQPVVQQIKSIGLHSVVEFKALLWRFPDEFLPHMRVDRPHLILQQAKTVAAVFRSLADLDSQTEFVRQIEWLLKYEFSTLEPVHRGEQYFEKGLFTGHSSEVFVDCGAFTGDTLRLFLRHYPMPHAMHAFEPEPTNRRALQDWSDLQPGELRRRIHVYPYAASDRRRQLRFSADGHSSAADNDGEIDVEAASLDEILREEAITFVKMDIEGAEPEALDGTAQLISRHHPVLAICVYHRQEHVFSIPHRILNWVPGYQLYLRRYGDQFGDVVCYAVPPGRASNGRKDRAHA